MVFKLFCEKETILLYFDEFIIFYLFILFVCFPTRSP